MSLLVSAQNAMNVMPSIEHQPPCYLNQLKALRDAARSVKQKKFLRQLKSLRNAALSVKRQKHDRQTRRDTIQSLKDCELFQQVACTLGKQRTFTFHQLEALAVKLNQETILPGWTVQVVGNSLFTGVLIQADHQGVCPTIVFKAKANGFERQSFHFDYKG